MSQVARPSYPFTLIVVPILPIPLVEIVVLVLLGMLVSPIAELARARSVRYARSLGMIVVLVASGGICKKEEIGRTGTPSTASRTSTTIYTNGIGTIGKTSTIYTFCTTINRYVDGGHDVPGVTGVPAFHGVAKLIDGPIFDLPGHSQKYLFVGGVFLAVATKVYKIQHDSLLGH